MLLLARTTRSAAMGLLPGDVIDCNFAQEVGPGLHGPTTLMSGVHHGSCENFNLTFVAQGVEVLHRAKVNVWCLIPLMWHEFADRHPTLDRQIKSALQLPKLGR